MYSAIHAVLPETLRPSLYNRNCRGDIRLSDDDDGETRNSSRHSDMGGRVRGSSVKIPTKSIRFAFIKYVP